MGSDLFRGLLSLVSEYRRLVRHEGWGNWGLEGLGLGGGPARTEELQNSDSFGVLLCLSLEESLSTMMLS